MVLESEPAFAYLFMQSATKDHSSQPVWDLNAFFFDPEWPCNGMPPCKEIISSCWVWWIALWLILRWLPSIEPLWRWLWWILY